MKKNIVYGILLILFAAGGIIAWVNSSESYIAVNEVEPEQQAAAFVAEAAVLQEVESFPNLRRETDSFVGIVRSDVANATDLTFADVNALVREAVALAGGLEGIVNDGDVVVLKPNLVSLRCNTLPGWNGRQLPPQVNGNTTDYRVTRVVAQMVRELNPSGRIYVMEGSAVNPTADVFRAMNYTPEHIPEVDAFLALEDVSGAWQDRNAPELVRVYLENALLHDYYYFNRKLFEADVLISLPVLKNHWDTVTTGTIKNLGIGNTPTNIYGDAPGDNHRLLMVNHRTPDLHRFIADYYTLRPADFTVMDGLQGLEHGPTPSFDLVGIRNIADAQKNMRVILASADSLAIDIVQANVMNWDAESVLYLQYLTQAGIVGNGNTANITVLGVKVDEIRTDFAGLVPVTGGRRITPASPTVSIEAAELAGGILRMALNVSADTNKLDIYIDGIYLTSVSENMTEIYLDLQGFPAENVTVYAFDRFMHHGTDAAVLESQAAADVPLLIFHIGSDIAIYRGEERTLEAAPFAQGGRTMVPFRFIGEAVGATVTRDRVQNTVYFSRGDVFVAVQIGTRLYGDDGRYLGTPTVVEGRTFVPLRFVSMRMDTEVIWNSQERTVTVPLP